jgi:glycosyltransferase involved in cell wall biosynthesis
MTVPARHLRVVVFVSGLGAGGAERVAVRICSWLRDANHEVCLLTLSSNDANFYSCPAGVRRVALDLLHPSRGPVHALWNNWERFRAVRAAVLAHGADVVISLGDRSNVLILIALIKYRCRKIISERGDPIRQPLSFGWAILRRFAYPMASKHVSQSNYVSKWLHRRFPKLPCVVIGNTAGRSTTDWRSVTRPMCETGQPLRLIAVGRLTQEKGMDLLVSAFDAARISCNVPIELRIIGEGERKDELLKQAGALGLLNETVFFVGKVDDVWSQLQASDIFVMPSLCEGFPNVMVEAMAAGLPVIASRCQGGVEDVLRGVPEIDALAFPPGDGAALSESIVRLANSRDLRQKLSLAGVNRANEYSPELIAENWRQVVEARHER